MSDGDDDHGHATKHPRLAELEGDGPRRPDRHDRRRLHRHAGPADGQARPRPGVPRRRDRARRPFLHVPPRDGHGDEHARGVPAHELGDRLRRLDRRADLGPAAVAALAARHGDGPQRTRSTRRRARRSRSRRGPSSSARSRSGRSRLRDQGRLRVRVLRPQGLLGVAGRAGLADTEDVRLLQRGLPPPAGDQGGATPSPAAHPDERRQRADRVQQGRGRQRPARGQHPLRPRPRVGRPERRLQARREGDRLPQRLGRSRSWPSPTIAGPAHPGTST